MAWQRIMMVWDGSGQSSLIECGQGSGLFNYFGRSNRFEYYVTCDGQI